jgi:heterodisulfide reductase subunit A
MMGYHVTVFEASPVLGGMMRFGIPAFRLSREILDREIYDIIELGVRVWRNVAIGRDFTLHDLFARGYKSVFLAIGAQKGRGMRVPGEDLEGVCQAVDFLRDLNLGQAGHSVSGGQKGREIKLGRKVVVVGGGNAALDTARSALRLGAQEVTILYRRSRIEMPAEPKWEIDETEHEGVKLMYLVTPTRFLGKEGKLRAIECVKMELGAPDDSGRRRPIPISGSEFTMDVDTVLIAVGQMVDEDQAAAVVDPSANGGAAALELTSRGTVRVDPVTLATNIEGVFSGGDAIVGGGTVIEAIADGKEAAISIDRYIRGEDLRVGREEEDLPVEIPLESVEPMESVPMRFLPIEDRVDNFDEVELGYTQEMAMEEAKRCISCGVCTECRECVALCERQAIDHTMRDEYVTLDVGTIVLATGFKTFSPVEAAKYGYGLENVVTGLEFERMVHSSGPTAGSILLNDGRPPESVAILHCVGSRDEEHHEYCSRVCCMYSLKLAHLVRESTGARVYEVYKDLRAFGKGYEEFYTRVEQEGVDFIHGEVSQVARSNGKLVVQCEDTFHGQPDRLAVDMVILGVGMEPREDVGEVAALFGVSRSEDGFLLEKHPKLAPVDTASDGIFVAGTCQGPKDIPDTVAQAGAAAAAAVTMIDRGVVEIEPFVPHVAESQCVGCGLCVEVCPYQAIELVERNARQRHADGRLLAQVDETSCKGCGLCVSACRGKAISLYGYNDRQLLAEIDALLAVGAD